MKTPRIVDTSPLSITSVESTQLREFSMHARSDMLERIARIKAEHREGNNYTFLCARIYCLLSM